MELSESLLAKAAGWEAMKQARALVAADQVLSSSWNPPHLQGIVQSGGTTYQAGLVIQGPLDFENLCSCRASREWGTICAHSVAIGLHYLRQQAPVTTPPVRGSPPVRPSVPTIVQPRLRRSDHPQAGEPLELQLILPPNLAAAVAKDRIMVTCEGVWRGRRQLLSQVPAKTVWWLDPIDARVLDLLEGLAGGEPPGTLLVRVADFVTLLTAGVGHSRVSLGRSLPVSIQSEIWRPVVYAELLPTGDIQLQRREEGSSETLVLIGETLWVFQGDRFQPLAVPREYLELMNRPLTIPRARVPLLLSADWRRLAAACKLQCAFDREAFVLEPLTPRMVLSLHGGLARLQAVLQCRYGTRLVTPGVTSSEDAVWLPDPAVITRYATRNADAENAALARLWRSGFRGPDAQGKLELIGQDAVLGFFAREYPRLCAEWEVTLEERLERSCHQNLERVSPEFRVSASGEQWFDLTVDYRTASGEVLPAAEVQRLLLTGQGYRRLSNGRMALLDTTAVEEWQEVLRDCDPQQRGSSFRIRQTQAAFLDATLRGQPGWRWQAPADWQGRLEPFQPPASAPPLALGNLEPVLRPYQKAGVIWLHFLRRHGFGGLLADEMGLGKTLQTLAFLCSLKLGSSSGLPSLVICPTSLVYNWQAEAARFTPELKVLVWHGPQREAWFTAIPEQDLVITSYALMRRDADRYQAMEFDTLVLDEAQHIKNRQTQNALAVKSVRAQRRLVLTGTPMENSVLDLWSIFDFLMPGYLGSAQTFRERYELPICRDQAPGVQRRLARRIRPFILRRTKKEVAPELPDKIEQIAYCELTPPQTAIYQELLQAGRREILAAGAKENAPNRMVVLTALLRLRQACCDLRLLKLEQVDPATASAKLELLDELLDEALDGNHRVLVFSQFVEWLALVQERLRARSVAFGYLDGATQDRLGEVARFQQSPHIPVFLISLKAGGTGLNLTAADTVIHLDPWWNPAVEEQATDRAHRLGQSRVVTSYKLIARGTVEEKILHLQQRKRDLIRGTIAGEAAFSESLTWAEIQELLAG